MAADRNSSLSGTAYVLAAIITWGAYFPLAKIVLLTISPATFLIIRLGVGAATLYLLNLHLRKSLHFDRKDWLFLATAGLVGIALHQLIQLNGLKFTSATNTGWTLTLIPPVTGILGWIWLREHVALQKIAGLMIAMFGVALLVSRGDLSTLSIRGNTGDLLVLASVLTWSVYTVMLKSRLGRYEPLAMAASHMLIGFVVFAVIGGADFVRESEAMSAGEWLIAVGIGIVPSGLAYHWWAAGLQTMTVIDTSMFLFIEAIVASVTGWLVLDEVFTGAMAAATVIIVLGVWMSQRTGLFRREKASA